jgi:hypothetical protein
VCPLAHFPAVDRLNTKYEAKPVQSAVQVPPNHGQRPTIVILLQNERLLIVLGPRCLHFLRFFPVEKSNAENCAKNGPVLKYFGTPRLLNDHALTGLLVPIQNVLEALWRWKIWRDGIPSRRRGLDSLHPLPLPETKFLKHFPASFNDRKL